MLKKLIIDEVGLARVTIQYCKKRLKFLRRMSKEGVRLALHRLGLAWRLRRAKTAIPKKHVAARIKYRRWVLRQPQANLNRWTFVDGTSLPLQGPPKLLHCDTVSYEAWDECCNIIVCWSKCRYRLAAPRPRATSAINGCPRLSLRSVCGQSAAQSAASLRLSLRQQFLLAFNKESRCRAC